MEEIKLLSLVIPAYKQEKIIEENIDKVEETLKSLPFPFEILVVVDGFVDKTYERALHCRKKNIRILGYKQNRGKGYAVKYGMLHAKGDIRGFLDAGMDINPTGISMLLNHMQWYDADIIVGSKLHPVSQVKYPLMRKVYSWGYRVLIRLLFGFQVRDTQVGIKFYKKDVVEAVFPRLLVKHFAFDVETLAVAYSLGFTRIYEAPIKLEFNNYGIINSPVFWKVILLMLWDTLAIFYRIYILHYYNKPLKSYSTI